jgi:hypothetical protein
VLLHLRLADAVKESEIGARQRDDRALRSELRQMALGRVRVHAGVRMASTDGHEPHGAEQLHVDDRLFAERARERHLNELVARFSPEREMFFADERDGRGEIEREDPF